MEKYQVICSVVRPQAPTKLCRVPDFQDKAHRHISSIFQEVSMSELFRDDENPVDHDSDTQNNRNEDYIQGDDSMLCAFVSKTKANFPGIDSFQSRVKMPYFWCNFCPFHSESKLNFLQHLSSEHCFRCRLCPYIALCRSAVVRHSIRRHQQFQKQVQRQRLKGCLLILDEFQRNFVPEGTSVRPFKRRAGPALSLDGAGSSKQRRIDNESSDGNSDDNSDSTSCNSEFGDAPFYDDRHVDLFRGRSRVPERDIDDLREMTAGPISRKSSFVESVDETADRHENTVFSSNLNRDADHKTPGSDFLVTDLPSKEITRETSSKDCWNPEASTNLDNVHIRQQEVVRVRHEVFWHEETGSSHPLTNEKPSSQVNLPLCLPPDTSYLHQPLGGVSTSKLKDSDVDNININQQEVVRVKGEIFWNEETDSSNPLTNEKPSSYENVSSCLPPDTTYLHQPLSGISTSKLKDSDLALLIKQEAGVEMNVSASDSFYSRTTEAAVLPESQVEKEVNTHCKMGNGTNFSSPEMLDDRVAVQIKQEILSGDDQFSCTELDKKPRFGQAKQDIGRIEDANQSVPNQYQKNKAKNQTLEPVLHSKPAASPPLSCIIAENLQKQFEESVRSIGNLEYISEKYAYLSSPSSLPQSRLTGSCHKNPTTSRSLSNFLSTEPGIKGVGLEMSKNAEPVSVLSDKRKAASVKPVVDNFLLGHTSTPEASSADKTLISSVMASDSIPGPSVLRNLLMRNTNPLAADPECLPHVPIKQEHISEEGVSQGMSLMHHPAAGSTAERDPEKDRYKNYSTEFSIHQSLLQPSHDVFLLRDMLKAPSVLPSSESASTKQPVRSSLHSQPQTSKSCTTSSLRQSNADAFKSYSNLSLREILQLHIPLGLNIHQNAQDNRSEDGSGESSEGSQVVWECLLCHFSSPSRHDVQVHCRQHNRERVSSTPRGRHSGASFIREFDTSSNDKSECSPLAESDKSEDEPVPSISSRQEYIGSFSRHLHNNGNNTSQTSVRDQLHYVSSISQQRESVMEKDSEYESLDTQSGIESDSESFTETEDSRDLNYVPHRKLWDEESSETEHETSCNIKKSSGKYSKQRQLRKRPAKAATKDLSASRSNRPREAKGSDSEPDQAETFSCPYCDHPKSTFKVLKDHICSLSIKDKNHLLKLKVLVPRRKERLLFICPRRTCSFTSSVEKNYLAHVLPCQRLLLESRESSIRSLIVSSVEERSRVAGFLNCPIPCCYFITMDANLLKVHLEDHVSAMHGAQSLLFRTVCSAISSSGLMSKKGDCLMCYACNTILHSSRVALNHAETYHKDAVKSLFYISKAQSSSLGILISLLCVQCHKIVPCFNKWFLHQCSPSANQQARTKEKNLLGWLWDLHSDSYQMDEGLSKEGPFESKGRNQHIPLIRQILMNQSTLVFPSNKPLSKWTYVSQNLASCIKSQQSVEEDNVTIEATNESSSKMPLDKISSSVLSTSVDNHDSQQEKFVRESVSESDKLTLVGEAATSQESVSILHDKGECLALRDVCPEGVSETCRNQYRSSAKTAYSPIQEGCNQIHMPTTPTDPVFLESKSAANVDVVLPSCMGPDSYISHSRMLIALAAQHANSQNPLPRSSRDPGLGSSLDSFPARAPVISPPGRQSLRMLLTKSVNSPPLTASGKVKSHLSSSSSSPRISNATNSPLLAEKLFNPLDQQRQDKTPGLAFFPSTSRDSPTDSNPRASLHSTSPLLALNRLVSSDPLDYGSSSQEPLHRRTISKSQSADNTLASNADLVDKNISQNLLSTNSQVSEPEGSLAGTAGQNSDIVNWLHQQGDQMMRVLGNAIDKQNTDLV